MVIEILSRFAFAIPMKTKDGKTSRMAIELFLEQFKQKFSTYPKLVQFDEGSEFKNKDVEDLFTQKDIIHSSTHSRKKASIVERLNRTLNEKILKLFERNQNHKWEIYLDDLVHNYNTQVNRSIKMKPYDVDEDNKFVVWGRLFGKAITIEKPKFKVGDLVRVLHLNPVGKGKKFNKYFKEKNKKINPKTNKPIRHNMLETRDKPPFSEEIFSIQEVLLGDPIVYKLYFPEEDLKILGKFYESELSLVRQ